MLKRKYESRAGGVSSSKKRTDTVRSRHFLGDRGFFDAVVQPIRLLSSRFDNIGFGGCNRKIEKSGYNDRPVYCVSGS